MNLRKEHLCVASLKCQPPALMFGPDTDRTPLGLAGAWLSKGQVTGHRAAGTLPRRPVAEHTNWLATLSTLSSSSSSADAPVTFHTTKDRGFQTLLAMTQGRKYILQSDPGSRYMHTLYSVFLRHKFYPV